jgi:hypothetical protein
MDKVIRLKILGEAPVKPPSEPVTRRRAVQALAAGAVVALVGPACDKSQFATLSCTDATELNPNDLQMRNLLDYRDQSTEPDKACDRCLHFFPGKANACGTCRLVRGPIHPKGTCKSFVPKIERS